MTDSDLATMIATSDYGLVRELHLKRAPVNALNPDLCNALSAAITTATSAGMRGIVLSGGPKVFSAGLDVPYLLSLGDDRAALSTAWDSFFSATRALAQCPVPVVAAIAGHAPAGGCVLALCCDYRVMASGPYRIGLNETQVGLVAPVGIQQLLRRVVGRYRAERLLVAGELVDAETALTLGLVDELAQIDQVAGRARAWLDALLQLPNTPMLRTRQIARADMAAALAPEQIGLENFLNAWWEPDTQAGLRALVVSLGK